MGCARCHDHKFDPLLIERLLRTGGDLPEHPHHAHLPGRFQMERDRPRGRASALRLEDLEQIIDRHDNCAGQRQHQRCREERTARAKLLEDAKAEYAKIPKAMAVTEGIVGDLSVFLRGNHLTKGPVAPAKIPDDPGRL